MTTEEPAPADGDISDSDALEEARLRRLELGAAADRFEDLIARPASDPRWTARVSDAMTELLVAFDRHVGEVEDDDGLLPRLLADEPRLANGIKRMYTDHIEIRSSVENTIALVRGCGDTCDQPTVESIRLAAVDLLRLISRHRQAGADLVYEAYLVDIGGS
jgi:hypothetical protein